MYGMLSHISLHGLNFNGFVPLILEEKDFLFFHTKRTPTALWPPLFHEFNKNKFLKTFLENKIEKNKNGYLYLEHFQKT